MSDPIFRNFHSILCIEKEEFSTGLSLDPIDGFVHPNRFDRDKHSR